MKALRPLLAAVLVLAALAAVVLLARRAPRPPVQPASAATAAPTAVPAQIVLFFPGDDDLLHRETREVPALPAAPASRVRLVVEELVTGSHTGLAPAFPWTATVETVFVDHGGDAFVDFSPPPADAVEGTATEMAMAYATANTVAANCPGIARVQLLFGGRQVETFGHLDLSKPLRPQPALVAP